jgi:hypothetical protein
MFGDEAEGGPSSFCREEERCHDQPVEFHLRQNKTEGGEEEKTCRYEDDGFLGKRFEGRHEGIDTGLRSRYEVEERCSGKVGEGSYSAGSQG